MRRFSIAAVVLTVLGAYLTVLGSTDNSKQQPSVKADTVKSVKKTFAQRRFRRMVSVQVSVQAEKAGTAAVMTGKAVMMVAVEPAPRPQKTEAALTVGETQPKPKVRKQVSSPLPQAQPAPAVQASQPVNARMEQASDKAERAESGPAQAANVDYLPPSMRNKARAEDGDGNPAATKPKPKAKAQQAGARVIYRTNQTSTYDRDYDRGYYRRNYRRYDDPWGW